MCNYSCLLRTIYKMWLSITYGDFTCCFNIRLLEEWNEDIKVKCSAS